MRAVFLILILSLTLRAADKGRLDVASSGRSTSVRGTVRKNGTYVAPHARTMPNGSKNDNWSTKGNVNPRTGKPG